MIIIIIRISTAVWLAHPHWCSIIEPTWGA